MCKVGMGRHFLCILCLGAKVGFFKIFPIHYLYLSNYKIRCMSNLLVIESATDICSVALVQNGKLCGLREMLEPFKHSERLTLLIQGLIESSNIGFDQLDGIGVSSGPGSYTSLRVGSSVAKGLCFGLNIPMLSLDTLRGIAVGMQTINPYADYFIPMIDARRMEVYCKVFDRHLNEVMPVEAKILEQNSFEDFERKGRLYLGGNGAAKTVDLFEGRDMQYSAVKRCNASFFEEEIREKFLGSVFEDLTFFEPQYLKSPAITKPKPLL
jgi:tRNA threonylcarbamoyladenosine biosynthesis protein TsaB